jgi:hypothetical protein
MKVKPTTQNIIIFSMVYQLYPVVLYFLAKLANPDPKPWGVFGIFAIAEFLLTIIILSWRRKAEVEVIDERETAIRLKVKSLMLNVTWTAMGITFLIHLGIFIEMPVWLAFILIAISGLIAEAYGNWIYRKL